MTNLLIFIISGTVGLVSSILGSVFIYRNQRREVLNLKELVELEQSYLTEDNSDIGKDELSMTWAGQQVLSLLDSDDAENKKLPPINRNILGLLYRPSENHVGVIYRYGRYSRLVDPNRWDIVLPWIETISQEIKLDLRTVVIKLENVLTNDKVAVDLELKAYYSVDIRKTDKDRMLQVLRFAGESPWEEIVKTSVTDIVRNVVVISRSYNELTTNEGLSYLKQVVSGHTANRLQGFGILINNRFGVSIMNFQPNKTFQEALQEVSKAKAIGNAAVDRLRPLLEQFGDKNQDEAFHALVMQIAAVLGKTEQLPDIINKGINDFESNRGVASEIKKQRKLPRAVGDDDLFPTDS